MIRSRAQALLLASLTSVPPLCAACRPTPPSAPVHAVSSAPAVAPEVSSSAPVASASATPPEAPPAAEPEPPPETTELADDDEGMDAHPSRPSPAPNSPLLALTDDELRRRFTRDKTSVGSLSVGQPSLGLLINGVKMGESPAWFVLDPGGAFGTEETVASIARCIERVREKFPDAKPLPIGHISAQHGGHLSPHKSHQAGRDVDLGYYLTRDQKGLVTATKSNLDAAATWVMVKTAILETPVEMIFMDNSVQKLLADFALAHGESAAFIDEIFLVRGKNGAAPIRHLHGHQNHLHIRFHSPNAQALAKRLSRLLPTPKRAPLPPPSAKGHGHAPPAGSYFELRARSGDTLVVWAKRFGVTVEEIQRANGLSGTALKIGNVYRIPKPAPLPQLPAPSKH